ncbi:MAG TPA: hypothetical protein VFO60_01655 [Candidatus Dormibacteraeota bacterium]|nr:hypothetical protein [Candidatus Dormibacteraeota bacterium]
MATTVIAPPRAAGGTAAARLRVLARETVRQPRRAFVAALALLSVIPCLDVAGDPDLWWHIRAGRWILDTRSIPHAEMFTYTAAGNPWTAHEWGSEVLFAALDAAGGVLLVGVVMALVTWSGLWALAIRARDRGASWGVCAAAMLLGARAMQPVTGTRPQMFTFALCCWTLLLAERHLARGGRLCWWLPAIVAVWANLHAGFLFGIGVVGAVAAIEAARIALKSPDAAPVRRVAELAAATVASAGAACLNPNGTALLAYAVRLTHDVSQLPIVEWMRPNILSWDIAAADLLVVSVPVLLLAGGRIGLRDALMTAAGTVAAVVAVRNLAVLVAVALPAWAALVSSAGARLRAEEAALGARRGAARRPSRPVRHPSPAVAAALLAVAALGVGAAGARAVHAASGGALRQTEPACAVDVLSRAPGSLRVFAPYAPSGYIVGALWPKATVYDYGELVAAGPQVLADQVRIASGTAEAPSALALLDSSRSDAVLVAPGALTRRLEASGAWGFAVDDPSGMELWVRGNPEWARGASCSTG